MGNVTLRNALSAARANGARCSVCVCVVTRCVRGVRAVIDDARANSVAKNERKGKESSRRSFSCR